MTQDAKEVLCLRTFAEVKSIPDDLQLILEIADENLGLFRCVAVRDEVVEEGINVLRRQSLRGPLEIEAKLARDVCH